jgi:hypothetical protein
MIQGANIPMNDGLYGFYTTRFIQALGAKRAELKVVDQIRVEFRKTHSVDSLNSAKASMDLKIFNRSITFRETAVGAFAGLTKLRMVRANQRSIWNEKFSGYDLRKLDSRLRGNDKLWQRIYTFG